MKNLLKVDKPFIKMLLALSLPIIAQNLVTSSLNLLDNIMIGSLGVNEISATGLANRFYLIFFLTTGAIGMGSGILISQYYGKRDIPSIKKNIGISIVFSSVLAVFFASIAMFFPEKIIEFFINDKDILELGSSYLRVVSPSYIFTALTFNYYVALRSTDQARYLMRGSLIGLFINVILNYIFIFGKLGAPALGVTGAALATTIARGIEFLYVIYIVHSLNNIVRPKFKEFMFLKKNDFLTFLKVTYPVVLNDFVWVLGFTMYSKAYAYLGKEAVATMQIATTVSDLFYMFGIGVAVASSIILGHSIGSGKEIDVIQSEGEKMNNFSILFGIGIGIIFFMISPLVKYGFNINQEIQKDVSNILKIIAFILPIRFYGLNLIVGTFRASGDVIYASLTEFITTWIIAIPITFTAAIYFDIKDIGIIYLIVCLDDICKIFIAYPRFKSKKWIKSLI